MRRRRWLRALIAALALELSVLLSAACGRALAPVPASPAGFPYAFAVHDCAPWDGPAVSVYFTSGAGDSTWPQVRVSVWRAVDSLPGNSFAWPSATQIGAASRCSRPDECVHATQGRITFSAREPDGALRGNTDLVFADGTTLSGTFRATLRAQRARCG